MKKSRLGEDQAIRILGEVDVGKAHGVSEAILLDFRFVHCPPCLAERPHLQKL